MAVRADKHQEEALKMQDKVEDIHKSEVLEPMAAVAVNPDKAEAAEAAAAAEVQTAVAETEEMAEKMISPAAMAGQVEAIRTVQAAVVEIKEQDQMETVKVAAAAGPDLTTDRIHYHGQVDLVQKDLLEFLEQKIDKKIK
jgi:hypothetical protein